MDLIKGLINDVEFRLGSNGASEIKKHPFFKNIEWEKIGKLKAPFIPDVII